MTSDERSGARRAFLVVSLAVLLATSTWFTGTAAARELAQLWSLTPTQSARLTSATQWGFIVGTLVYAATNLADRFDARRVFCISAIAGALCNLGFAWLSDGPSVALGFRFATGITLAGVYPVGMKLIASWYREGLGWRLGVMVGCLTLGTAFPYGVAAMAQGSSGLDWVRLASVSSFAAALGGLLVAFGCGEGPLLRTRARFDLRMIGRVFRHRPFRATAFGYFGHMWELYALWSLAGVWLAGRYANVQLVSFAIVGAGALGCIGGGLLSRRIGERKVAMYALAGSGAACLFSGFMYRLPPIALLVFLLIWGVLVVADSPQFSALAARHAPPEYTGTALTVQNGLGFLISTISIQLLPRMAELLSWQWALTVLALGPALGVLFTSRATLDS